MIAIATILVFFIFRPFLNKPNSYLHTFLKPENATEKSVIIAGNKIIIETAQTPKEKEQGLSGREYIPEDHGMLFIISPKSRSPFWMVDMKFPLDIIWISDNKIVQIDENAAPPKPGQKENELPLYKPPEPVDFVLEVNGGFTYKHKIMVGDTVEVKI